MRHLLDHPGARLLAFPQRYDAVAGSGALPDAERVLRPQLRPDRPDYADDASDLVLPAAEGRAGRRPPTAALFAGRRHGRHLCRAAAVGQRRQLSGAVAGGGPGRYRLGGVPPGSLAGRADGLGWAALPRGILVPGRPQWPLRAPAPPPPAS